MLSTYWARLHAEVVEMGPMLVDRPWIPYSLIGYNDKKKEKKQCLENNSECFKNINREDLL
jgi:hypothetical protein